MPDEVLLVVNEAYYEFDAAITANAIRVMAAMAEEAVFIPEWRDAGYENDRALASLARATALEETKLGAAQT